MILANTNVFVSLLHLIPSTLPIEQRTGVELFFYNKVFEFMNYNKPALSVTDQIVTLQQRGLIVSDVAAAESFLNDVSYFRMAAYMRVFENPDRTFRSGTTFEQVVLLYNFDLELRRLIFGAVQTIEIALRSRVIHQFSLSHGPFWFVDASLAISKPKFAENLSAIQREIEHSKEDFIKEHTAKYGTMDFPPAWKVLELVSFGCLTKLYINFDDTPAKKRIARSFGVAKYETLESWMRSVNALRNACAHHARVWNRVMTMIPQLPRFMGNAWVNVSVVTPHSLYAHLCCLVYWLNSINRHNNFADDLKSLLAKYPTVNPSAMGFDSHWQQEPLWM